MKILVIAGDNYPSNQNPQQGTFVYGIVQQFINLGHEVTVIAHAGLWNNVNARGELSGYGTEKAKVYRPKYLSLSNKRILFFNTYAFTTLFQKIVIQKLIKKHRIDFDLIYCHFIPNALIAARAVKNASKPIFAAVGEYNNIDIVRRSYNQKKYFKNLKKIRGFISVSAPITAKLLQLGIDPSKILTAPNAVNLQLFKPHDKIEARKHFNLPLDKKLILFVGRFIDNKGPLRLLEALKRLPDDVLGIFVGKGNQKIEGEKVIFCKALLHAEIPLMMSAADLFVLPTLHEGSCNVIIEAMACGLPIVSSDIPEIRSQTSPSCAVLVDPLDTNEIYKAMCRVLENNDVSHTMRDNAIIHAAGFSLAQRATNILNFISSQWAGRVKT